MSQIRFEELSNYLENKTHIIGCDECGYGAWSGPLVVCGVQAPKDWNLVGLNDSKKLSAAKREALQAKLLDLADKKVINCFLVEKSNIEIDKVGVGVALKQSYVEVFKSLYTPESLIVSDGILKFDGMGVDTFDQVSIIKADGQIPAVMAASILAKTYRDSLMKELHKLYPEYDWENNVGYGVASHKAAIKKIGFTELHRRSYNIKI
jgi:ribonuclease HII